MIKKHKKHLKINGLLPSKVMLWDVLIKLQKNILHLFRKIRLEYILLHYILTLFKNYFYNKNYQEFKKNL